MVVSHARDVSTKHAANRRMRRTSVRIPSSRDVSRRTIDVGNGVKKRFRVSGFTLRDLASIGSTIVSDYGLWYDAAACARVMTTMNWPRPDQPQHRRIGSRAASH